MREIAARTDSGMRLGPGSLYGSLKRLLEAGLIAESAEARLIAESAERPAPDLDDERRRYYRLTEPGWVAAQVEAARLEALVRRARAKRLLPEAERAPGEGSWMMARRPARRLGTLTLGIYTWLLRAYPAPFRRRFGAQLVQVFQDGCRDARRRAGMVGLAGWWLLTLRDLSGTALREHIVARTKRRQEMEDRARTFGNAPAEPGRVASRGPGDAGAGRHSGRAILLLGGLGLLWGVGVQAVRAYGQVIPGLTHLDFVWLEVLGVVLLLGALAFRVPRPGPVMSGLLVTGFCSTLLVVHYGYYAVALALGAGRAARVDVDLADPGSYRFLWNVFTGGISGWLLFVQVAGFGIGWTWGIVLRGPLRRRDRAALSGRE